MHDQAEGLRRNRNAVRILAVLSLPGQPDSADSAARLALAWNWMGGRPLLVDGTGRSAARLLGCQPMFDWSVSSGKHFADCVLVQDGRAAVVARNSPAGDAELARQASNLGYRDLVFDGGELGATDAPLDANSPQAILLLAQPDRIDIVYAMLKGLRQAQSPARIWLLWHQQSPEAIRLQHVCSQRLGRSPAYLGDQFVSPGNNDLPLNRTSASLQENDFRSIVVTMLAEQSLRGEETPSITARHA
ncbi:MAG TPA: hypothetical protein VEP67_10155 [Thiobacillaceae bacterium]|nr:hypothetical protein [Thiobacillaceae bacterium]